MPKKNAKKHQAIINKINRAIAIMLILSIGAISGYTMGFFRGTHVTFPEIKSVPDINENVATIKLLSAENGKIKGEIAGQRVRMAYSSENNLELEPGTSFEIPMNEITLSYYYQTRNVPADALFVASKKGKYYYSVFSKSAFGISEENRTYFSSKKEAENQGFKEK
ncbi:hypothetical protein COY07_04425 [Candidatus Peregrinibacteria bacterium CG_4_10_14_0_2_um_filter_43_11]|nr:MAG: hypothetical protein COY07_04425 [Candidatus Peregrinibacteria bacterium CG_4_10_14_0_2_um_filter_43_11]